MQRLACICVTGAFPTTPTVALEVFLNLPPLHLHLKSCGLASYYRLKAENRWFSHSTLRKTQRLSHMEMCSAMADDLPILSMRSDRCTKHKLLKDHFSVILNTREEWESGAIPPLTDKHNTINQIMCYSDGSRTSGKTGAGAIIYNDNNTVDKITRHLGSLATVFQSEIVAIHEVAEFLRLRRTHNKSIDIYSDSKAGIYALRNCTITSHTVKQCKHELNALARFGNTITLHWIPGHRGFEGNEQADQLAGEAAAEVTFGPEPTLPVSSIQCKNAITKWMFGAYKSAWERDTSCRQPHVTMTGPDKNRNTNKLLRMNSRLVLRQIIGILTGHCALQKHLHTIGRADDAICPMCGETVETTAHFIGSCPAYYTHRIRCWGTPSVTLDMLKDDNTYTTLVKYLKSTKRLFEPP